MQTLTKTNDFSTFMSELNNLQIQIETLYQHIESNQTDTNSFADGSIWHHIETGRLYRGLTLDEDDYNLADNNPEMFRDEFKSWSKSYNVAQEFARPLSGYQFPTVLTTSWAIGIDISAEYEFLQDELDNLDDASEQFETFPEQIAFQQIYAKSSQLLSFLAKKINSEQEFLVISSGKIDTIE